MDRRIALVTLALLGLTAAVSSSPVKDAKKGTKDKTVDLEPVADASTDYEEGLYLDGHQNYRRQPSSGVEIDHSIELEGGSQNFFPAFANLFRPQPLGHSRPLSYNQEGAYSQRPSALKQLLNYQAPTYNYRNNDYGKAISSSSDANSILGSGNFGVIRGGTYFSDSSDTESQFSDSFDSSYNNGHGRPSFFYNQNPRPNYNQEQFANFRDFADINAPASSAFSHYVVVYANKNGTVADNAEASESKVKHHLVAKPKNIMETLAQMEEESEQTALPTEQPSKKDKTSKGKLKLALLNEKKHAKIVKKMLTKKDENQKEVDPLLALS